MDYICIFARAPRPGKTKTRLGQQIGMESAAKLSEAMLRDLCDLIQSWDRARPWLWFPPTDSQEQFIHQIPASFTFKKQVGENLGMRLKYAFHYLFQNEQAKRICIIGSDCLVQDAENLTHE